MPLGRRIQSIPISISIAARRAKQLDVSSIGSAFPVGEGALTVGRGQVLKQATTSFTASGMAASTSGVRLSENV